MLPSDPKISMFCALSQNYQLFLKNSKCILKQIVQRIFNRRWHCNFSRPNGFSSYGSKQFDLYFKNCLTSLNFLVILIFLDNFYNIHIHILFLNFSKVVDIIEIAHTKHAKLQLKQFFGELYSLYATCFASNLPLISLGSLCHGDDPSRCSESVWFQTASSKYIIDVANVYNFLIVLLSFGNDLL